MSIIFPEICIWVIPELTTMLKETQIPGTPERNIETENIVSLCQFFFLTTKLWSLCKNLFESNDVENYPSAQLHS